ncbi:DUF3443 family protein [Burkholderia alba]|uniref:DUF3443 family protein n=1 Tax=Burkholderia alba TaxID=2683677 RepID=UPI002B05E2EC|nr:DUF3443 family protein [Burkholderia alba]
MRKAILTVYFLLTSLAFGYVGSVNAATNPAPANVLPLTVHYSSAVTSPNIPTVSITLCVPGYTDAAHCQTIPDILVDTGASGVRIVASVLNPALQKAFVPETYSGKNVAECLQYVNSSVWGSVSKADIWLGTDPTQGTPPANAQYGNGVPFQLIGGSGLPAAPSQCSNIQDTVAAFGSNGTIGVSPATLDGELLYYTCSSTSCARAQLPSSSQVPNPVVRLPADNNGVVLQINALGSGNAQASGSGNLILGIGTETNNKLAASTTIAYTNSTYGMNDIKLQVGTNKATTFAASSDNYDAFDSGTNDLSLGVVSGLASGSCNDEFTPADCPAQPTNVSMMVTDGKGTSSTGYAFTVASYSDTTINKDAALSQLADHGGYMLIGFPYFYGKTLYFAIEGASVSSADGQSALVGPFNGL